MARLRQSDTAPDFTLPTADGGTVSLAALLAGSEKGVIVYFYPRAASPGCTTEACDFRDNLASLAGAGYGVVGISADALEEIRAFATEQHLTFPLASDGDHAVAEAYGTWGPKTIGGKTFEGVHRSTFVIAPDGVVRLARYDVDAEGHVAELRSALVGG